MKLVRYKVIGAPRCGQPCTLAGARTVVAKYCPHASTIITPILNLLATNIKLKNI